MGWTFTHRPKGISNKEWFEREWAEGYEQVDVASGSHNRNNVYVALRKPDGLVVGVAIRTKWVPKDYHNFGWKSMDESMGPVIDDMPERIYELLSPLEEIYPDRDFEADGGAKWAKAWRERVEAHHEKMRNRVKLRDGLVVSVPYDLNFAGGRVIEADTPFVVQNAKRRIFSRNGWSFRLRKQTVYDFEEAEADSEQLANLENSANGSGFKGGTLVLTRGINDVVADGKLRPLTYLRRHFAGDWGDLTDDDRAANEDALKYGSRLFSAYNTEAGKIWIITEADRSATTVLFPDEY
jgi:hypothetical protein